MSFLNRYSFLVIGFALIALGTFFSWFNHIVVLGWVTFLGAATLIIYFVAARRGSLTPVNPGKRIRRARGSDRPVIVCFYHDFNLTSLMTRPLTARAEREHKGHCDFIYIDAYHREAEAVLNEFEAEVGDWLLFDAAGSLVEKCTAINTAKVEGLRKHA